MFPVFGGIWGSNRAMFTLNSSDVFSSFGSKFIAPEALYALWYFMDFAAKRLDVIEPSPTLAITARAKELKSMGKDVIGFGAGEPDFDTPEHIKHAAIEAIKDGQTKYTPVGGTPALKKAVRDKFEQDNGLSYEINQITASTGGKQVLFNLFLAYLNPGDEVIVPAPYWVSYADIVRLAEGKPVLVHADIEREYVPAIESIEAAITPKTRAIIINSPSNPTGGVWPKQSLEQLAELLKKHPEILIVSDDIYEHILYTDEPFLNLPMVDPSLKDRTVIVNGVSKAYSMTGWRLGYAAGPAPLIKAMETIQGQSTSNPCSITQAAAVAALSESQDCVKTMLSAFRTRRDLVERMLGSISGVRTFLPQGAFYIFPDISELYQLPKFESMVAQGDEPSRSKIFCKHLLDHYEVAAVPGIAFGDDNGLRISYALDEESLRTGINRIGQMINDLRE